MKREELIRFLYDLFIGLLALLSIILIILDFNNYIDLNKQPYHSLDIILLLIFWIDYLYFFIITDDKKNYFKKNIFTLIAILPLNEILSLFIFFRILRLTSFLRLTKFMRLIRAFSFLAILKPKINRFLYTNGFIYSLYFTTILIIISSFLMNLIEKNNFSDSLWWSIVTATTVGYGDIAPQTLAGRIIAVILMFTGIGFISMLTSTITNFFTKKIDSRNNNNNFDSSFIKIYNNLEKEQQDIILNLMNILMNNKNFDIHIVNKNEEDKKQKNEN